mgnify:FL=1
MGVSTNLVFRTYAGSVVGKNGSARTGARASYSCRWSDKGENEDACNLQSRSDVNKYLRGYSDIS